MRFQRQALGQSWVRHARSRLFVPETAGAAPSFNPADYGADYSWWAARLESFTNGQNVTTWTDRGSGTLTVSAGAGQEPTFHTSADPVSPNGQPFLRWASGDRLLNAVTGIAADWTVAIVCRPTAITSPTTAIVGATATTAAMRFTSSSGGRLAHFTGVSNIISGASYVPLTPVGWSVIVAGFTSDALFRFVFVFKDGLTNAPSPDNYLTRTPAGSGTYNVAAGSFAIGGNPFVGEIAEAVVWRSNVSNANKILIGKALSDLYGVTY